MKQGGLNEDDAADAAFAIRFGKKPPVELPQKIVDEIWDALVQKKNVGQEMNPLGRVGKVRDVVSLVLFLASSESGYITGQAININGGAVLH